MAGDNKTLGRFILDGIPPAPRGVPQIEVTFDIDANGILDVRAKDRATSREQTVRITASSMLSKDDVDKMVRDAQEHAEEDRKRREVVDTRNDADQLAFQAERTLRDLGDKVKSEDKADVESKVTALREALKSRRHRRDPGAHVRACRLPPEGQHGCLPGRRSDQRQWRRHAGRHSGRGAGRRRPE